LAIESTESVNRLSTIFGVASCLRIVDQFCNLARIGIATFPIKKTTATLVATFRRFSGATAFGCFGVVTRFGILTASRLFEEAKIEPLSLTTVFVTGFNATLTRRAAGFWFGTAIEVFFQTGFQRCRAVSFESMKTRLPKSKTQLDPPATVFCRKSLG